MMTPLPDDAIRPRNSSLTVASAHSSTTVIVRASMTRRSGRSSSIPAVVAVLTTPMDSAIAISLAEALDRVSGRKFRVARDVRGNGCFRGGVEADEWVNCD